MAEIRYFSKAGEDECPMCMGRLYAIHRFDVEHSGSEAAMRLLWPTYAADRRTYDTDGSNASAGYMLHLTPADYAARPKPKHPRVLAKETKDAYYAERKRFAKEA